jgi:transposase
VKRVVTQRAEGNDASAAKTAERRKNTDIVAGLVAAKVRKTSGRMSAKRLLPIARAEGYSGSARNFRRLVAKAKRDWQSEHHRGRRPAVWSPGETLVIDWGSESGLHIFCAVSAWSRWRFVRFADNERSETTLSMLAECFECLGGVPKVVLADRMGCLKAGVVANLVVPTAEYLRFATHYGFRPDFCQAHDPESKGIVENLVGYAKRDLMVPKAPFLDLASANAEAAAWCAEVNAAVHSEICAVPAERLVTEAALFSPLPSLRPRIGKVELRKVDRLSCVRFGSARYSVPMRLIGKQVEVTAAGGKLTVGHLGVEMAVHDLVAPGETSVNDDHYGGPRPDQPQRAPRPRTASEIAMVSLGEMGVAFLTAAAASAASKLGSELPAIVALEAAYGKPAFAAAIERATTYTRFSLADIRSILDAGAGVARIAPAGQPLNTALPAVPTRPLSAYGIGEVR